MTTITAEVAEIAEIARQLQEFVGRVLLDPPYHVFVT